MAKDKASLVKKASTKAKPSPKKRPRDRYVRLEARPLSWKRLTDDQWSVVVSVHEWLKEFVRAPLPKPTHGTSGPFNYQVFKHRRSNVILIDGGRGSGKTSVLITMLELWQKRASGQRLQEVPVESKRSPAALWNWVIGQLNGPLAGRLIPVHVLDLQPLPASTSLLAWLAARLRELMDHLEDPSGLRPPLEPLDPIASWQPDAEKQPAWRRAWQRLVQCAAQGWNSNLPERRGTLDPDSYAVELNEAERARLDMVGAWRDFTRAIVADAHALYPNLIRPDARLIIPIDDADMNPHRCVELLELMRTLWSPHAVFVLTGHSKLFLKMLQLHHLNVLRKPHGNPPLTRSELSYLEAAPHPRTLALQVYDKTIPSHHRFFLQSLKGSERLALLKKDLRVPIVKVGSEQGLAPRTLAGYFKLNPLLCQGLPHKLRRIMNSQQVLYGNAAKRVHALWLESVDNSERTREEQRELRQMVQLGKEDEALRVVVRQGFRPEIERLSVMGRSRDVELHLNVVTRYSFGLSLKDGAVLPQHLSALLELAANVAADEASGRFPHAYPAPSASDYPLLVSQVRVASLPLATLSFHWPIPEWIAPVDFALFDAAWTKYMIALNRPGVTGAERRLSMVYLYLSGLLGVGLERKVRIKEEKQPSGDTPLPAVMSDCEEAVRRLADAAFVRMEPPSYGLYTLRERAFRTWLLSEAMVITAPEYGLPDDLANKLLYAWWGELQRLDAMEDACLREKLAQAHALEDAKRVMRLEASRTKEKLSSRILGMMRFTRRRRTEAALQATGSATRPDVEQVLEEIDRTERDFDWAQVVEGREASRGKSPSGRAEQQLQRIRVKHAPRSSALAPQTLADYLVMLGGRPLLLALTDEHREDLERLLGRYESEPGSALQVLTELWATVTRWDPKDEVLEHGAILPGPRGAEVQLANRLRNRLTEPVTRRQSVLRDVGLGEGRTLRIYSTAEQGTFLTQFTQLILQAAHDVDSDERDGVDDPETAEASAAWLSSAFLPQAVTVIRVAGRSVEVGWPVPRWTTFLDWKMTDEVWRKIEKPMLSLTRSPSLDELLNELVLRGKVPDEMLRTFQHAASSSEERTTLPAALESSIHALAMSLHTLCRERATPAPEPISKPDSDDFAEVGYMLHDLLTDGWTGLRFWRIREWVTSSAALFGAPETGMSPPLARGFLRGLFPESSGPDSESHPSRTYVTPRARQRIRRLRRERIRVGLEGARLPAGEAEVRAVLGKLDEQAGADHIWLQVFGRDSDPDEVAEA